MSEKSREPIKLGSVLGCLIGLPLLLVAAILSIPYAVVAVVYLQFRERRLLRQLEARRRALTWKELERHLVSGAGTLVIEQANKVGIRFWWTPDDLTAIAPFSPISNLDEMGMDYIRGKSSNPFVLWCYKNYLSTKEGKAFLCRSIGLKLPRGPLETDYLQNLYPKACIVQTVLLAKAD